MEAVLLDPNPEAEAMLALDTAAQAMNSAIQRAAELGLNAEIIVKQGDFGRARIALAVQRCEVPA